jgi:pimeloyl-ACP methyl ester carboxylesterase
MRRQGIGLAWALSLLAGAGCVHLDETCPPAYPSHCLQPASVPECCRNKVFVFIVQGADPFDLAGVGKVRAHLLAQGFHKVYHGYPYHYFYFAKEIRRLHARDPEARFVLIGHRAGAHVVRALAWKVNTEGIPVDLLVYLDPVLLEDSPVHLPDNVHHVVNIVPGGSEEPSWFAGAENFEHTEAGSLDLPTHPDTLDELTHQVALVAAHVPVVTPGAEPSTVTPAPAQADPAWEFLLPHSVGAGFQLRHLGLTGGRAPAGEEVKKK